MITDNRALRRAGAARGCTRAALAALCLVGAMLVLTTTNSEAATIEYEPVTEAVFLHELDSGQVVATTINKRARAVRVTLKDGSHVTFKYAKHDEPHMHAVITARGVPVTVLSEAQAKQEIKEKPVHHKIRYIVGGVVIALIVIVGAFLIYRRRRRRVLEEG